MYVATFNRKFLSYFIIIIFFLLFDGRRYLKEIESLKDIEIALDIARWQRGALLSANVDRKIFAGTQDIVEIAILFE